MVDNIVTASVSPAGRVKTRPLYQYDYGQILKITGIDLPAAYEVHFANSEYGASTTQIGNADGVAIPDAYLLSGADVFAWLYFHSGTDDGETVYKILIPVCKRAAITPEQPTPVQQDVITQAIAALDAAVAQTAQDVEDAEAASETAQSAAASAHLSDLSAQQSATEAADSATQAASSAQTATTKATEAATSATAAQTAQGAAAASAQTAQTAATSASAKADEAAGSAATASGKASDAANSANAAQSAANSAAAAQSAAETAQTAAETAADEAESSAEDAQSAAEAAETLMIFPATGGESAAVATVTDAASDQPMALKIGIEPVQDSHGYDNPWPAGGGKNKFTTTGEASGKYLNEGGEIVSGSGWMLSDYIPVSPSTQYTFNPNSTEGYSAKSWYFDANKLGISAINSGQNTFSTPDNCYFMRFSYRETSANIQLELGSTATAYAPYSNICPISGWTGAVIRHSGSDTSDPNVYSIDFPTEAGTVYGGTLEIAQDGTGTLMVDKYYLTLANTSGISYHTGTIPSIWLRYENGKSADASSGAYAITNMYVVGAQASSPYAVYYGTEVDIFDDRFTDEATGRALLADFMCVYKLATPQTYTFTAEQIKSIFGTNNVWADCGNTQITAYTADKTLLIQQAEQRVENLTVSSETLPAGSQATVEKQESADGINLHFGIPKGADGQSGGVTDVQVNGTSVVQDGVAEIPVGGLGTVGVMGYKASRGLAAEEGGLLRIQYADSSTIKAGADSFRPIVPTYLPNAIYFGLAKLAGEDMKNMSGITLGVYPEAQKSAISTMLNSPVSVSGATPTITALSGIQYVCGEVATLDITLPASGIVDVVFESGSTPTALTVTPPTGMTEEWANGFDSTSLEANTLYELNIRMVGTKCLGVAGAWS